MEDGDRIDFELPLAIQRTEASDKIAADRGRIALRYGPLIYNLESVDQNLDAVLDPTRALATEWRPDLLGGVRVMRGPVQGWYGPPRDSHYARLNRGGRSIVWIKAV